MAALYSYDVFKKRNAALFYHLKDVTAKVQRTASSIGFIKHAIYNDVIPKFAKLQGQFDSDSTKHKAERKVL